MVTRSAGSRTQPYPPPSSSLALPGGRPMATRIDAALSLQRLTEPEIHENPYPFYKRLRTEAPIHWDERAGLDGGWVLTRHADVLAALKSPHLLAGRTSEPATDWVPEEYRRAAEQVFRAMPHQLL